MRIVAFLIGCGIVATLALGSVALAAGPPVISVGPVGGPNGTGASGTVGSGGQADACLNDQHSGTNPSDGPGSAQVNDRTCTAGAQPSGGAGTASSARASGGGSASGSQSGGGRAQAAGLAGTKRTTQVVAAGQAIGLRIASIKFVTRGVGITRRLGVLVTVRDRRGLLVKDAIVSIRGVPSAPFTIGSTFAGYSNRLGQAMFKLPVGVKLGGKRVLVAVSARTPTAKTRRVGAVRLPRLAA